MTNRVRLFVGGCGGSCGWDVLCQAQNAGVFAQFAVDFIDAVPGGLLARRGLGSGQSDLYFQAIRRAANGDATGFAGRMAMETMAAGRDDGSLELQNHFIGETRGIGKIAGNTSDSGDETVVGIHAHGNLMGSVGHGYRDELALASATSHASRQSGQ